MREVIATRYTEFSRSLLEAGGRIAEVTTVNLDFDLGEQGR